MTRVKICGITEISQALAATEAGADYLGLVFAGSPRQILPERAVKIVNVIRRIKSRPLTVGVFVNSPPQEVNLRAEICKLDWVQLSGIETWEYCREIIRPILKTIHVSPKSSAQEIIEYLEKGYRLRSKERLICLLDAQVKGAYGGTGQTFDWQLAKEIAAVYPVIIAGGLTPENVGQMVKEVQPWGVDVSSGVETLGKKDILKIQDFIQRVRKG